MSDAYELDECDAKVAMLEEAARIADSLQDKDASIEARMELIETAALTGFDEKALVAFSWCLPVFDAEPERFLIHDFLWRAKWVAYPLDENPSNSLETIDRVVQDIEKRFENHGYSLRPMFKLRAAIALGAGLDDVAMNFLTRMKNTPRDSLADCEGCEEHLDVAVNIAAGRYKEAIDLAIPLMSRKARCNAVPNSTYAAVLEPLIRFGRYDEAREFNRKGQRLCSGNRGDLSITPLHLRFRTHIGDFPGAIRLVESNFRFVLETTSWDDKFRFYFSMALLFEALIRRGTRKHRKMRLPKTFELWNNENKYELAELHAWFHKNSLDIAARFDKRNGTTAYVDHYESVRELILRDPPS